MSFVIQYRRFNRIFKHNLFGTGNYWCKCSNIIEFIDIPLKLDSGAVNLVADKLSYNVQTYGVDNICGN